MPRANIDVAWVKRNGFQEAEAFAGVAGEGHKATEFRSAEKWRIYQRKARKGNPQETGNWGYLYA